VPATPGNTLRPKERDALVGLRRQRAEPLPGPAERRAIRSGAGVAVDELADALGVSAASVYAYETGARRPSRRVRDRYVEALRLLGGDGE